MKLESLRLIRSPQQTRRMLYAVYGYCIIINHNHNVTINCIQHSCLLMAPEAKRWSILNDTNDRIILQH